MAAVCHLAQTLNEQLQFIHALLL